MANIELSLSVALALELDVFTLSHSSLDQTGTAIQEAPASQAVTRPSTRSGKVVDYMQAISLDEAAVNGWFTCQRAHHYRAVKLPVPRFVAKPYHD
jgi:hypothetical protein